MSGRKLKLTFLVYQVLKAAMRPLHLTKITQDVKDLQFHFQTKTPTQTVQTTLLRKEGILFTRLGHGVWRLKLKKDGF